jgi:hypothetical protein
MKEGLVIRSALAGHVSHSVWVAQTQHSKRRNKHEGPLGTDLKVHLPTESDQVNALLKANKLPLVGLAKEARLQVAVAVRWKKLRVVAMKKIQVVVHY